MSHKPTLGVTAPSSSALRERDEMEDMAATPSGSDSCQKRGIVRVSRRPGVIQKAIIHSF